MKAHVNSFSAEHFAAGADLRKKPLLSSIWQSITGCTLSSLEISATLNPSQLAQASGSCRFSANDMAKVGVENSKARPSFVSKVARSVEPKFIGLKPTELAKRKCESNGFWTEVYANTTKI